MIYKCKNCGQNYYEKPDFCECGNNVFVLIKSFDNTNSDISQKYKDDFSTLYPNNEFVEQEDILYDKNNSKILIVFSCVIFVISLILSSVFLYKGIVYKPVLNEKNIVSKNINNKNIPYVDTYWDNSIISSNKQSANIRSNKIANIENIIFETPKTKPEIVMNKIDATSKSSTENKNTNSVKKSQKTVTDLNQKVTQVNEKPLKNNVEKVVTTNKNIQNNKSSNDIPEKVSSADIKKQEQEIADLLQYKADLRLRLFQHFPILNVFGYGVAVIGFNISSEGKLNNRRFIQQSENKSLNDALYHMLMSVPIYSPPPKYYKGEDIVLKMDFNNGYYSFSFVE